MINDLVNLLTEEVIEVGGIKWRDKSDDFHVRYTHETALFTVSVVEKTSREWECRLVRCIGEDEDIGTCKGLRHEVLEYFAGKIKGYLLSDNKSRGKWLYRQL